jgi:hypothetical protein
MAWFGEQFLLGLLTQALGAGGIAYWAHVGGFATGAALGAVLLLFVPGRTLWARERTKPWYMQEEFNKKEEDQLTVLNLSGAGPQAGASEKQLESPVREQ